MPATTLRHVRWTSVVGTLALAFAPGHALAQALPPPRDGDVRVLYHELRDLTEVWLTLEPKGPAGETLPILLTFNVAFPGKRPAVPVTQVEMRAYVGRLWNPRPELTLVLDGKTTLDVAGPNPRILTGGDYETTSMTAVVGTLSTDTLKTIGEARSVSGNALRLPFVLNESQRQAIAAFRERIQSADPARAAGRS
jgi:hypothetical protein